jgi:hypothetical protein
MTTTQTGSKSKPWLRFLLHYLEMVVAMLAGMFVFGALVGLVTDLAGVEYSHSTHPAIGSTEMALTMSAGMAIWMLVRGHSRRVTLEMVAAMCAPLVVVLPLLWLDVLPGSAAIMIVHVAMFPLMVVAMLLRREEYTTHHHSPLFRRRATAA